MLPFKTVVIKAILYAMVSFITQMTAASTIFLCWPNNNNDRLTAFDPGQPG